MLQDLKHTVVYLAIDALDECEDGLPELLDLIAQTGQYNLLALNALYLVAIDLTSNTGSNLMTHA
jgi:hypothetical protein